MSKLLITGSSGFIGNYFLEHYKEKYDIKTFSFLQESLEDLSCEGVDVVLHLSALVHQMGGASEAEYERVNVMQTLHLAKKAKESGVGHFVFMSSVKVYGEESDGIYIELTPPHPQDAYGKSKLKAEQELQKLEDEYFRLSIIRTPIVYGYGVKANIASLVNLVKRVPFLPFGGIKNKRSMVYVGNLCRLTDAIVLQKSSGIFLAADDIPLSTTRLIELIANAMGKRVYLFCSPFFESVLKLLKPSFHKRLYGSLEISAAETNKKLNFQNLYSTQEGIEFMINGEER